MPLGAVKGHREGVFLGEELCTEAEKGILDLGIG